MTELTYTPAVLRNRGIPVEVYQLDEHDQLVTDDDGNFRRVKDHVRFDANTIVGIEERWSRVETTETALDPKSGLVVRVPVTYEGISAWQHDLDVRGYTTCRATLAIAWGVDEVVAGRRMVAEDAMIYQAALGGAWMIANGVDPAVAGKALREAIKQRDSRVAEMVATIESELTGEAEEQSDPELSSDPTEPSTPDLTPTPQTTPAELSTLGNDGSHNGSETLSAEDLDVESTSSGL